MPGQGGGFEFSDGPASVQNGIRGELSSIHVHCGEWLDGIRCFYRTPADSPGPAKSWDGNLHGIDGGSPHKFDLAVDEFITSVTFWWNDTRVRAIQFMTSEGRLSDRFGDLHLDEEVTRTGFQNGNFNPLLGFHGHAENWVNEIECIWEEKVSLKKLAYIDEPIGGNGGHVFSPDAMYPQTVERRRLEHVTLHAGSQIDAIQWSDSLWTSPKFGGNGGTERSTAISGRVISVTITYDKDHDHVITYIKLITENPYDVLEYGQHLPGYVSKEWKQPAANMAVIGFAGRCGERVDRMSPIWATI